MMAIIGDWLTGSFDFFGTTVPDWMVAVPALMAIVITIVRWNS
jgi:hypothetical protein